MLLDLLTACDRPESCTVFLMAEAIAVISLVAAIVQFTDISNKITH